MLKKVSAKEEKELSKIIKIDEASIKDHLGEMVRDTVEETLNSFLSQEADNICGAKRYERSSERKDTRAGSYARKLDTRVGRVKLNIPKLRTLPFNTAIIERYRRREISVEEAMIEMYLAGVSTRKVTDITEALWGTSVSASTVSDLNNKVYEKIEEWRSRPIEGEHAYVYLDGIVLKRTWGHEVKNVSILVAIGVNSETGYREVLGVAEGAKEDKEGWLRFIRQLKARGLKEVRLIISDKCLGLIEAIEATYPEADWQRCIVHFYRNIFSYVPRKKMKEVSIMLKAIHAQENKKEARRKAESVAEQLRNMRLHNAADILIEGIEETFSYYNFPKEHWVRIRTNNPLERLMKEIRRRTKVVGSFPDGRSALMLAAARLRYVASSQWGKMAYLNMGRLKNKKKQAVC